MFLFSSLTASLQFHPLLSPLTCALQHCLLLCYSVLSNRIGKFQEQSFCNQHEKHEFPEGSHHSNTVDLAGLPALRVFFCSFFLLLLLWCLEGQVSDSRRSRVPNVTSNISNWISPPSSSDVTWCSAAKARHGEKWLSGILVLCILSRCRACEYYPCLDLFLLELHVWQFSSRPS